MSMNQLVFAERCIGELGCGSDTNVFSVQRYSQKYKLNSNSEFSSLIIGSIVCIDTLE